MTEEREGVLHEMLALVGGQFGGAGRHDGVGGGDVRLLSPIAPPSAPVSITDLEMCPHGAGVPEHVRIVGL